MPKNATCSQCHKGGHLLFVSICQSWNCDAIACLDCFSQMKSKFIRMERDDSSPMAWKLRVSEPEQHSCIVCNRKSKSMGCLPPSFEMDTGVTTSCPFCIRKPASPSIIMKHLEVDHNFFNMYDCPNCGQKVDISTEQIHLLKSCKSLPCPECKKSYRDLDVHLKTHFYRESEIRQLVVRHLSELKKNLQQQSPDSLLQMAGKLLPLHLAIRTDTIVRSSELSISEIRKMHQALLFPIP